MSIVSDARLLVTGFGSVLVVAGDVETRGLFDDQDAVVPVGDGSEALVRVRALTLIAADVPDLLREDTITIGTLVDDTDRTSYRVVDVQRQADGVLLRVLVAA